jgi:hypothetical protein
MILYLSGNFPQLSDIDKERAMAVRIEAMGHDYHRLLTFYYENDCKTILQIGRELREKKKPIRKTIKIREEYK